MQGKGEAAMTKPMTAADELRPYLNADPRPEHVGCGVVAQLLTEHDEQRDRADEAERRAGDLNVMLALYVTRFGNHAFSQADMVRAGVLLMTDAEVAQYFTRSEGDDDV